MIAKQIFISTMILTTSVIIGLEKKEPHKQTSQENKQTVTIHLAKTRTKTAQEEQHISLPDREKIKAISVQAQHGGYLD